MAKNGNQPVTKKELRTELKKLEDRVNRKFAVQEEKINEKFAAQGKALGIRIDLAVERAEERINAKARAYHDRLMSAFDQFVKEIRTARDERIVVAAQLSNHEDRLGKLESVVLVDKSQPVASK